MCERIGCQKKISVVIPVYNSELFLDRCIKSILQQNYENWEIIAVDDGSKDCSLDILRNYGANDSRITVVHQENSGAGLARNEGILRATGDYIVFVDSDDYLEEGYFKLLNYHEEDVVFIDVNRRNAYGKIVAVEKLSKYKTCSKDEIVRSQLTGKMLWGGVRKAVKRRIIHDNSIRYSKHRVGEEAIYSFEVIINAETFGFIDTPVYNYEVHENSLSQVHDDDPWGGASIEIKNKVLELGMSSIYGDTVNALILTAGIVSLDKMAIVYSLKVYKEKARKRIETMKNSFDMNYSIDKEHMSLKAKMLSLFVLRENIICVYWISKIRKLARQIKSSKRQENEL